MIVVFFVCGGSFVGLFFLLLLMVANDYVQAQVTSFVLSNIPSLVIASAIIAFAFIAYMRKVYHIPYPTLLCASLSILQLCFSLVFGLFKAVQIDGIVLPLFSLIVMIVCYTLDVFQSFVVCITGIELAVDKKDPSVFSSCVILIVGALLGTLQSITFW